MGADVAAEALLALWEAALGEPPASRGDALLAAAAPSSAAAASLGERNARLLALHERLFGGQIPLLSRCPACATAIEFGAECRALAAAMPVPASTTVFERDGYRLELRLPAGGDVAAAASAVEAEEFALRLLDRCVLACVCAGGSLPVRDLPPAVLDGLSRHLEASDPGARVSFALACPQCGARWNAPLEVDELLWRKVRAAAERLLLDVDALARGYGWTEGDVLRLSPTRRAAYLQLVSA